MRNVTIVGLVLIFALSMLITGTILAQDDGTDTTTAWLGVRFVETDDGVVIRRVVNSSPAEAGGLLEGDLIVSVDDQAVESSDALTEIVQAHEPGDVISVVVLRDDTQHTLDIELGSTPVRQHDEAIVDANPLVMAERVLHVELDAVDGGYQVLESRGLSDGTLAVGDVITAVNGTPITGVDWPTLLSELADQDDAVLTLTVDRGGEEITVDIERFGGLREHGTMDEHGGRDRRDSGSSDHSGAPGGRGSQDKSAPDASSTESDPADSTTL